MARVWPDTLPTPSYPGFGLTSADPAIRTDMEVGVARVRRLTFARNDKVNLRHRLRDSEMGLFRAWWEDAAWSLSGDSDSLAPFALTTATLLADSVVGPDGIHLADRVIEDTTNAQHFAQYGFGSEATDGGTILCRATIKAAGRGFARLTFVNRAGTLCFATVDLTAGTIAASASVLTATVESRGNGWWRITITALVSTGATVPRFRVQPMTTSATTSYLGDGVSGIDVCEQHSRMVTGVDGFLRTDSTGKVQGAANGTAWVQMPLATGGGWRYQEARYTSMFQAQAGAGLIWDVTSEVEVR